MSKVCPLMFTSPADLEDFECRPDCCAWANDGGCAVTALVEALDRLNDDGIIAWTEKEDT